MEQYLRSDTYIDWQTPAVRSKALELADGQTSSIDITKACFEFVRDEIRHSWDFQLGPVTIKASDVLEHKTGYCYSKSHLLAALLRANGIPAALCYQRLTFEGNRPPFCIHGLNAVHLEEHGWVRIDARGNKEGVQAEFDPPRERLAFEIKNDGETDIEGYFSEPIESVIGVLTDHHDYQSVAENLPDFEILETERDLLTLEAANARDFDHLVEIRIEAMKESLEAIGRFDRDRSVERFRVSFLPEITKKIKMNGDLVGFIAVSEYEDHLHLEHLYIRPIYQSDGIGTKLMVRLIDSSERKGIPIRLGALRSSRSNGFYQKHGFTVTREDEWDIYYERKNRVNKSAHTTPAIAPR